MADTLIPILDLKAQYQELRVDIGRAIEDVLEAGEFINGRNVKELESEVARYLGVSHAVALNSGTDALHLALRALDIGPGDEVITTPFTFVATTEAIGLVGARPVFVDIDPMTYLMDVRQIEAAITTATKAILPVHLYGNVANMEAICALARAHNIVVVEDCAQSMGATLHGKRSGTFGDIGAFSFFPSKNLGAYGDGGMLVTHDEGIAARVRSLRAHGGRVKYHHEELGLNSRLDELQAAILRVKLPHLDEWNEARRAHAAYYADRLAEIVKLPVVESGVRHVYHQFTVEVSDRDAAQGVLKERGIQTMVYYPVPLHLQRVHSKLGYQRGHFPHAEAAAERVLSLPMYPELTSGQLDHVVSSVERVVGAPLSV